MTLGAFWSNLDNSGVYFGVFSGILGYFFVILRLRGSARRENIPVYFDNFVASFYM